VPGQRLRVLGVADCRSIHLARWARRLADRGFEVHVVSDRLPPDPSALEGVGVHDLRRLEPRLRLPYLRRGRIVPAIRALAERLRADVVHAHYLLPYGYWAAQAGFHPLVVSPWGSDVLRDAKERPRGRAWAAEALDAADALVVNSEAVLEASLALGGRSARVARVIWHADLGRFGPERAGGRLRERFGWPADSLVVLSLRNYRPDTNLDVLLRAFARVAPAEPRARLLLAGRGGPQRGELERLAGSLGLAERVALARIEPGELPAAVADADVAVTLARSDSAPASLLEVMASGLPVVAGRAFSIDEWVDPGEGGLLVDWSDEAAVAEALSALLADGELRRRYGEHNRRVVHERVGDPGEQLERVYRELAERTRPGVVAAR
jgi:glycosyltransferase involved in cell wall biosynthesis